MKTEKWITEAQRKFTIWKKETGWSGDCSLQEMSKKGVYNEKWILYATTGRSMPEIYWLEANKHGVVHVIEEHTQKRISITEIDISGMPPIVSESSYRN